MANNPYVNKVVYGNSTVLDLTGDTVTTSDVKFGVTFHDATGEQKTGTKAQPVQISPSNDSPPAMSYGGEYKIINNGGFAIASYGDVTPDDANPPTLSKNMVYRIATNNGKAIKTLYTASPSDSSPANLVSGRIYKADSGGYFIKHEPTSKTPSDSSAPSISSGEIIRNDGNSSGYLTETQPVSTTPSDSTPPSISSGDVIYANGSGYLYETIQQGGASGTISDTTGASQTVTINTGLSTVNKFSAICTSNTGGTYHGAVFFNRTNSDSTYEGLQAQASGGAYKSTSLGTQVGTYCPIIDSISGGIVTLKTPNIAAAAITNGWWMAC